MLQYHPGNYKARELKKLIIFYDGISALVLLLLLYTGLSKITAPAVFKFSLIRAPLLKPFAGTIAWLLPVAEITSALLLFFKATRLKGLHAALMLLASFTVYLGYMLLFSADIPCTCGGVLPSLSWPGHIIFNVFFMTICTLGIVLSEKIEVLRRTPP